MPSGGLKTTATPTPTQPAGAGRGQVPPQQLAAARQTLQLLQNMADAQGGAAGQAPPAHGFALVINLTEILAIAAPLFFLALKLAFMLYVFGRHASPTKRYLLISLCVLYVIYEGFAIRRRRAALMARQQEAVAQAARREARRAQGNGPPDGAAAAAPRAGAADRAAGRPRGRRGVRGSTPASKWTVKYWANLVAHVGLEAEARDMGIAVSPPTPGAPVPAGVPTGPATVYAGRVLPARQPSRVQRIAHAVYVGTVLFVGTLVPEVEKRRKRALDRRERLRSQLQTAREQALARAQEKQQDETANQSNAQASTSAAPVSAIERAETMTVPDATRANTPQPDQPPELGLFDGQMHEPPPEAEADPAPAEAPQVGPGHAGERLDVPIPDALQDDSSDGGEEIGAAAGVDDQVGADLFVM